MSTDSHLTALCLTDPRFTAEIELSVPFHDIDAMGVVWHGNYFRYFELAREALLDQIEYGYREMCHSGYLWPIVDCRVKYRDSLRFQQRLRLRANISEYLNRLRIDYQIFDADSGKRTTTAYTIQVAVNAQSGELCFVCPDILFNRMGVMS